MIFLFFIELRLMNELICREMLKRQVYHYVNKVEFGKNIKKTRQIQIFSSSYDLQQVSYSGLGVAFHQYLTGVNEHTADTVYAHTFPCCFLITMRQEYHVLNKVASLRASSLGCSGGGVEKGRRACNYVSGI